MVGVRRVEVSQDKRDKGRITKVRDKAQPLLNAVSRSAFRLFFNESLAKSPYSLLDCFLGRSDSLLT